jgi:glutathione synthase/RimK-type ligase-like ATP-grasp enzyme
MHPDNSVRPGNPSQPASPLRQGITLAKRPDPAEPTPLIGLAALMRMAFSGADLAPLGMHLLERAGADADPNVLMDLSIVLQLRGERALALAMQEQALQLQQLYAPPTAAGSVAIRLLAIMAPGDLMANTPLEFLLEDSTIALDLLYVAPDLPLPAVLPQHDLLFIAIGESDQNIPLLHDISEAIESWPRPVLNLPRCIAQLSRDRVCALLQSIPGLHMPDTVRIERSDLEKIGHGQRLLSPGSAVGQFPLIIRPVGSHAGHGLARIEEGAGLLDYLLTMPQQEFYLSRFIDYRGSDGLFRKYRIVLIDGEPFLCHMAISSHWMIHYLNAGMAESAAKRAEEAHCMLEFDHSFAQRHAKALQAIYTRTELDYVGIDCSETADGKLLIFEVDSNMIVHGIDPADVYPYKQVQMRKVFSAFREMLGNTIERAANPG